MFPLFGHKFKLFNSRERKGADLIIIDGYFFLLFGIEILEEPQVETLTSPNVIFEKNKIIAPEFVKANFIDFKLTALERPFSGGFSLVFH
jgi:hypothetical protein